MPDFLKLLSDKFGDTYDSIKDRVKETFSKKYEDYVDELKALAPKLWEGDPEAQIAARRKFEEIKGALSAKDALSAQDLVSEIVAQKAVDSAEGGVDAEQRKIMKDAVKSNLALSGVKAVTGLAQIIDGAFKKKKLQPPKFPPKVYKNNQLATEIAKNQVLASEGDPAIRAQFEDDLAEKAGRDEARARATGNIGSFSSLLQASGQSTNDALRKFAADESTRKDSARNRLSGLLNMSINEDAYIQGDAWKRFYSEEDSYVASMNQAQAQINSGFNNLFTGLNEGAATAPYASLLKKKQSDQSNTQQQASNPSQFNDLLGAAKENGGFDVSKAGVRPINLGEMMMLGNAVYRTPENVELFQENAKSSGLLSDGYVPGEWDNLTEDAFNQSFRGDYEKFNR